MACFFFVSFSMFRCVFECIMMWNIRFRQDRFDYSKPVPTWDSQVWCITWTGLGNPWVWGSYNGMVKPLKWFYTDIKSSHICLFHSSDWNNFGTRYIHRITTRTITRKDQIQFSFRGQALTVRDLRTNGINGVTTATSFLVRFRSCRSTYRFVDPCL